MSEDLGIVHIGQVTNREDPENLGRVKIVIPGLVEPESCWAWPLGSPGGGSAQSGHFEPPHVGASVAVLFRDGDIDSPLYICGPWGASDLPAAARVVGEDRQNATTEDKVWLVERDSRSGQERISISHKSSSLKVVIDGGADKVLLSRGDAAQALVKGTAYRSAEVSYQTALYSALSTFAHAISTAVTLGNVIAAGGALETALGLISGDYKNDATAFLSTKSFTE